MAFWQPGDDDTAYVCEEWPNGRAGNGGTVLQAKRRVAAMCVPTTCGRSGANARAG